MNALPPLLIVTEATARSGAGHAMRMGAFGAAWRSRGGRVRVGGPIDLPFVREYLAECGATLEAEPAVQPGDVLAVDSYDAAVRDRWSVAADAALRVLVDDENPGGVPAGYQLLWNPNAYGSPDLYRDFAGEVVTGPDHLALRPDLPAWQREGDEIFVTVGGGAPAPVIAEAFAGLDALAPDLRFAGCGDWLPPRWRRVQPSAFWQEASRAAHLITAAGITAWESAVVGIPVVLLMTAHNQRFTYRWGRDAGVPGLSALAVDGEFLAHQLRAMIEHPGRLPAVKSGADRVARIVADRALARRTA